MISIVTYPSRDNLLVKTSLSMEWCFSDTSVGMT